MAEKKFSDEVDRCHACGSTETGRSPTGWWCRNCGLQDPCPCWNHNHQECVNEQNKYRRESGMEPATVCCCGDMQEGESSK